MVPPMEIHRRRISAKARPGDRLLLANYGDGADAMSFGVGDPIEKLDPRRGVSWHLERRCGVTRNVFFRPSRTVGYPAAKVSNHGIRQTILFVRHLQIFI